MKRVFISALLHLVAFGLGYALANQVNRQASADFQLHAFDIKWAAVETFSGSTQLSLRTLDGKFFTISPSRVYFKIDAKQRQPRIVPNSITDDGTGMLTGLTITMPDSRTISIWEDALRADKSAILLYPTP